MHEVSFEFVFIDYNYSTSGFAVNLIHCFDTLLCAVFCSSWCGSDITGCIFVQQYWNETHSVDDSLMVQVPPSSTLPYH